MSKIARLDNPNGMNTLRTYDFAFNTIPLDNRKEEFFLNVARRVDQELYMSISTFPNLY